MRNGKKSFKDDLGIVKTEKNIYVIYKHIIFYINML